MTISRNIVVGQVVAIALTAFAGIGCNRQQPSFSPTMPAKQSNASPPQQRPLPDLAISAARIVPHQPVAGQRFALNVCVTNQGHTRSGPFDLVLFMRDVSRGGTYPIGTFRHGPLNPGENVPVYASANRLVNFPGLHQLHVNVTPMEFADSWPGNNVTVMPFHVR